MKENSSLLEIPAEPTWLQKKLGSAAQLCAQEGGETRLVYLQLVSTTTSSPEYKHHRLSGLSNTFIFSQFRKLEVPDHDAAFSIPGW